MSTRPKSRAGHRRRAEARPEEILAAARVAFEEKGFDAARMEDIAARAGLSKAGVYLYFESKDALLRALIRHHVAPVAEMAARMAEAGHADPAGTLRALARALAPRLADPALFAIPRLVISVSNRFPEIAELYRVEVLDRARGALSGLIEAGIEKGHFRPVDPASVVRALIGSLIFEALRVHVFKDPQAEDLGRAAEAGLDLLLHSIGREASS